MSGLAGDVVLDKPVRSRVLLAALPEAAAAGRAQCPSVVRPRVLVVDRRPVSQMVTRGMAEHLGYEVVVAGDDAQAVDALAGGDIAVVLLDCPSPGARGCSTASALRGDGDERRRTPVVAIVAADDGAAEASWCRDAGVDAVLTRPVSLHDLGEALTRWTGDVVGQHS